MRFLAMAIVLAALSPVFAHASSRPDSHAPIGIMGDHMHNKGEWMISYRFMEMAMEGNRDGTRSVPDDEILQNYSLAATRMRMQMHMIELMVAPWQRCTLMLMSPYLLKSMDHVDATGVTSSMTTEGFGDLQIDALVRLLDRGENHVHVMGGLSVPTGLIDRAGTMHHGGFMHTSTFPYDMQLGSGTLDPILGLTWTNRRSRWSWGAQATGVFRLADNNHNYHLGSRGDATGWAARMLADWASASGRLALTSQGNIDGADPDIDPTMIPSGNPALQGGTRVDAGAGINFVMPHGTLHGLRLAVELAIPLYQNLDGPQLQTDWTVVAGIEYSARW